MDTGSESGSVGLLRKSERQRFEMGLESGPHQDAVTVHGLAVPDVIVASKFVAAHEDRGSLDTEAESRPWCPFVARALRPYALRGSTPKWEKTLRIRVASCASAERAQPAAIAPA